MTGLVRKATLITACGMLLAAAAMAGVPNPGTSTVPGGLSLVGNASGVPDTSTGVFQVTVRDLASNPINASSVAVDFSAANADEKICTDQLNANYTINCTAKTIRAYTNAAGQVRFTLNGGSVGGAAISTPGSVKIFADGVLLTGASFVSAAFDLDGANGVGGNDLSVWLTDFGTAPGSQRGDYDYAGGVGGNDLSIWLTVFGLGGSANSCVGGTICTP